MHKKRPSSLLKKFVVSTIFIFLSYLASSITSVAYASSGNEYLALNSFSGHPGSTIQVSGGNFQASKTINFYIGNNKVSSSTTSLYGEFKNVSLNIPINASQGSLLIKGAVEDPSDPQQATNSYYVTPLTPSITSSYTTNTPNSTILISGSGFGPSETVTISLGNSINSAITDLSGNFQNSSLVVPNISSATYPINAKGGSSLAQGTTYFYIGGFYPSAYPSSYFLLPDQTLKFNGSGFMPSENIQVSDTTNLNSQILSTFSTDTKGNFINQGSLLIPFSYSNKSLSLKLLGMLSNVSSTITVNIGSYYASVSPTKYSIMPNDILNFNGSGFAANENIDIFEDNSLTPANTIKTDINGSFLNLGNITIPYSAAGKVKTYKLIGQKSAANSTVSVNIGKYYVNASASSYYILPGQILSFSGSGYIPGETISITEGKSTIVLAQFVVNPLGNFVNMGSVTIPYSYKSSTRAYHLIGDKTNNNIDLNIGIGTLQPQISASDYYVLPGQSVSFSGSGFAANENIQVNVGLVTVSNFMSDSKGNVIGTYIIPFKSPSNYHLSFLGVLSNASVSIDLQIASFTPSANLDNYYSQIGTTVNASGNSFASNEKIDVTINNLKILTIQADKTGSFLLQPIVLQPIKQGNSEGIVFTGEQSGGQVTILESIKPFTPQIQPSTYYAKQGSLISFSGSGYPLNDDISIMLNNIIIGTIKSNNLGSFVTSKYTLPYSTSANFTFTSSLSGLTNLVNIGLEKYYSGVSLDNYYSVGGSPIIISASGYAPSETVNITFGGVDLGNHTTDITGKLIYKTIVPFSTAGEKIVKVTGNISNSTAQTTFTQAPIYVSTQLGNYASKPGSIIKFIGSGYLPGETVTVTSNRAGFNNLFSFMADINGNFNSDQILPLGLTEGNITLSIQGNHSLNIQSIVFYVLHS